MKKALIVCLFWILGIIPVVAREWTPLLLPDTRPVSLETVVRGENISLSFDSSFGGTVLLFIPEGYKPSPKGIDLVVHFHTNHNFVRQQFTVENRQALLLTVNFPGLSAAYRTPFQNDSTLWSHILSQAMDSASQLHPEYPRHWRKIGLTSFSAGYGAVRELLKNPTIYSQIQEVVLIDSLHTGIKDTTRRELETEPMEPFVKLAKDAVKGKKLFITSHSAIIPETYAGTPETNQYLIQKVNGKARLVVTKPDEVIQTTGKIWLVYDKGRFHVRGYTGTQAISHLSQLWALRYWFRGMEIGTPPEVMPKSGQARKLR